MGILDRRLSLEEIKNLNKFKYASLDNSLLHKYVTRHIFILVQRIIPRKVLPNTITLSGFFFIVLGVAITFIFNPSLGNSSSSLKVLNLLCLVGYFIADGVDGVHARVINKSTAFGYFLDHAIDTFGCLLTVLGISSSLNIGYSMIFILLLLNIFVGFYLTVLHYKFAGIFKFGYISGCSEGIVFVMFLHIFSIFSSFPSKFIKGYQTIFNINVSSMIIQKFALGILLYNILHYLYTTQKYLTRKNLRDFLISSVNSCILFVMFYFAFVSLHTNSLLDCALLIILFTFSFSILYIEETISLMLKSKPDTNIFIIFNIPIFIFWLNDNVLKSSELKFIMLGLFLYLFYIRFTSILNKIYYR